MPIRAPAFWEGLKFVWHLARLAVFSSSFFCSNLLNLFSSLPILRFYLVDYLTSYGRAEGNLFSRLQMASFNEFCVSWFPCDCVNWTVKVTIIMHWRDGQKRHFKDTLLYSLLVHVLQTQFTNCLLWFLSERLELSVARSWVRRLLSIAYPHTSSPTHLSPGQHITGYLSLSISEILLDQSRGRKPRS